MLSRVTAVRFDGRVQSGRTVPCRLTCEAADGTEVEVVAKLSDGCDRKVTALVMEAIAAQIVLEQDALALAARIAGEVAEHERSTG